MHSAIFNSAIFNSAIFTIGYGGRVAQELIAQLQRERVQFLVDVRSVPYSRYQPEFCRNTLSQIMARKELRYVYMGDVLGGRPSDADCYTEGHLDCAKRRAQRSFQEGLARLKHAWRQELRLCLLCAEAQPQRCHRTRLLGVALAECGIEVLHLMPQGGVRSQTELIRECTGGQESLFRAP